MNKDGLHAHIDCLARDSFATAAPKPAIDGMVITHLPTARLRARVPASRKLDEGKVRQLMESIPEIGFISPLRVRPIKICEGNDFNVDGWQITAGRHRYEAAYRLNLETVPCDIVDEDNLHAELAMIDENLIRASLTPAQEDEAIFKRKLIYEKLYPETKAKSFKGNRHTGSLVPDKLSFTKSTSAATGKDERSIRRAASRGSQSRISEIIRHIPRPRE